MSIEKVREYLSSYGLAEKIIEFDVSSATVELAAAALSCEPCQIAKSMAFLMGEGAILVVAAGDVKIDNAKFKQVFGTKAKMLTPDEVIEFTGHAIGGVCPFAITNPNVKTYLDISMKRFDTVLPAAGSSNSCVRLSPDELEKASRAVMWADICKSSIPAPEDNV